MKWLLSALMVLLLAVPAFAFNLDVLCPTNAFLPGDEVSCNLRLREATPREMLVMQADVAVTPGGWIRGSTPYLDAIAPVAGEAGAVTDATPLPSLVLFTLNPAVLQSNIATLRFRIATDAQAVDYRVELQNVQSGNAANPFVASNAGTIRVQLPGQRVGLLLGDVTGDGQVNTGDAIQILRFAANLRTFTSPERIAADVTCDGNVNTGDAIQVLRLAAVRRGAFTACAVSVTTSPADGSGSSTGGTGTGGAETPTSPPSAPPPSS